MNKDLVFIDEAITNEGVSLTPNQVCLANESRFNSSFFSEPLTVYATGWRDPNDSEALLDFIAPPVQVSRRFEYKSAENAQSFLTDTEDTRAIGSDFKQVEYKGTSQTAKTYNKGLVTRIDLDSVSDVPNWRELYTTRLLQRLIRSELRRAIDTLSTAAANTAKTWDTTAGKDPDQDVLTEMLTASDSIGFRPNRVVFGDVAWNKRLISHRAQATAGGFASASLSADQLAGYLGVDGVRISRERYQSTAAAKGKVVPDIVLMFVGIAAPTPEDATHMKRFWSATESGGKYRVYEQQVNSKLVDLTVEHYSNAVLTSSVGLRKLTIS